MGREIKRVALDFDWPVGKIWTGYKVGLCHATGENCKECKMFAEQARIPLTGYGCPVLSQLEPPQGEGYQLWETISEGSPMSPVFDTPEKLARWLVDNNASTFGYQTTTYENWLTFIKKNGDAFTMIFDGKSLQSGVDYIAEND